MVQFFRYLKRYYVRQFANATTATMRFMIYNNILHKEEKELNDENMGSLMTKAISDVDVCVEMQKPDMFSLVHIKEDLQHLFGRPVDIVRLRDNMNPMLSKQIQRDGIYV